MARKKVLIVEDDPDLRRLYAIALNQRGYEVKLAANGAEALDRLVQEKPDVMLLDLMMPVMSGFEVLEKLNPDVRKCVPVIVISGHSTRPEELHHQCIAGWLTKPVAIDELTQSIASVLPRPRPRHPHPAA
jgi:DNA-binding response OmpR family regulator